MSLGYKARLGKGAQIYKRVAGLVMQRLGSGSVPLHDEPRSCGCSFTYKSLQTAGSTWVGSHPDSTP